MNDLVSSLNNSMAMWWGVPTPGEPKVMKPGLARDVVTKSFTVLMPVFGWATNIKVP